jgi:RimJ/RimL family protein N-acetyltransferase
MPTSNDWQRSTTEASASGGGRRPSPIARAQNLGTMPPALRGHSGTLAQPREPSPESHAASVFSVADETTLGAPCLYTERLCLRVPTSQDAEGLYSLFADSEVMQGLGKEPMATVEEVRAMIKEMIGDWRADGFGAFVLETVATDRQVVGQAGLMIFDTRDWSPSNWSQAGTHAQPELGWALTRAHWGHGYATEAAAAIRDWTYERLDVDRLVSLISPANTRSQRVARRLGAIPTETITPAASKRTAVVWTHQRIH